MNVWKQLDQMVAKRKTQALELIALQKEGGVFRQPRFRPPCVWVLITGARAQVRGEKTVCTTYEEAKAVLEPPALKRRAARLAKAALKAAELAAKKGGPKR